jgi:hypothetical protein
MEFYLCPAWLFNGMGGRWIPDARVRMHAAYLASNLLLLAALPPVQLLPHFCLLQTLVGIPCPGCGITHAVLLAFALHFRESLAANPAGVAIAATIGFQFVARPWAIVDGRASNLVTRISRWLGSLSVACLSAVWISTLVKLALLKFHL